MTTVKMLSGNKDAHGAPTCFGLYDKADYDVHGHDLPSQGTLRMQNGPRKESGVNGFTADEVLQALCEYHGALLKAFPSAENEASQKALESALATVQIRTKRREAANVEGTSATEV